MTSSFIPQDQAVRDRVEKTHDRLFTVEAGAGTGKTSLLTEKYVQLISSGQARPTQIVAMTFTEKAAGDLKDRIRSRLHKLNLSTAATELDRAPISTIHAFAASLLRERPLEAGLDPNFCQLDAISADLFLHQAYHRWLTEILAEDDALLTRALGLGWTLEKIRELAFSLYAYRDLYPTLAAPSEPLPFADFLGEIGQEISALQTLAETSCQNQTDEGYRAIQNLAEAFALIDGATPDRQERGFLFRISPPTNKGAQRNWSPAKACKEQKERMKALRQKVDAGKESFKQNLLKTLTNWLGHFLTYVENEKRIEGVVDFDDLLLLSRNLLRDHLEVRTYFQRKYRYLLIDEFQDTDPIQAELIWLLAAERKTEPSRAWHELSLQPGKLFLVGDPKQSIYRFRRADVDVYRHSVERVAAQGERLLIQQNFRSSPPLVNWINTVFSKILKEEYVPLLADPSHQTKKGQLPVTLLEPPPLAQEPTAREVRLMEAETIAAFLRQGLTEKTLTCFDKKLGTLRSATPGDIAVLFPVTTDIDLYEEAFRQYKVPFVLEGGHLFYGRAEVHALLATLEAIDRPTDSIAVVAALRSVLFGASDQDLVDLCQTKRTLDYREGDLDRQGEPIRSAFSILRTLHRQREEMLPSELLNKLLEMTAAIPITLVRRHGEQAVGNLEKMIALAFALERKQDLSLSGFVQWVREREKGRDGQAETALSTIGFDQVRFSTIHKAKGLEFPIVVVANLSGERSQARSVVADRLGERFAFRLTSGGTRYETSDFQRLAEAEKAKQDAERSRLLYVAATRACDQLIFPRFVRKKSSIPWKILEKGWAEGAASVKTVPHEALAWEDRKEPETPEPTGAKEERDLASEEAAIRKMISERAEKFTRGLPLRTATSLVHEEVSSNKLDPSSPSTKHSSGRALALGSAVHQIMEQVDFSGPENLPRLASQVCRHFGILEQANQVEELVTQALTHPLFDRVRKAERVLREMPFSWQRQTGDETYLFEGAIDLLFVETDGVVIVDYKTDHIRRDQLKERTAHYAPQLQLYMEAIADLTRLPVKEGLLFFLRLGEATSVKFSDMP